jgi:hypothetical protein
MSWRLIAYYRNNQIACDISFETEEDMRRLLDRVTYNRSIKSVKMTMPSGFEQIVDNNSNDT